MKKLSIVLTMLLMSFSSTLFAQPWAELTGEQKMMKLESFVKDNHVFMKDSLKLSDVQINDVDNVNLCYLATLDRIDRYGKTDGGKEKYASYVTSSRAIEIEAIMGSANYDRYFKYVYAKLQKAGVAK